MKRSCLSVLVLCGFGMLMLGACTARIDQWGKKPEPEKLAQIKPGIHSREDVMRLIGSPTNTGAFDDKAWYYIHKVTETTSFLDPKILEEDIVIVSFDSSGMVKELRHEDAHGKSIEPVRRVTPSAGNEETILQQVFGNFGRFSKKGKKN